MLHGLAEYIVDAHIRAAGRAWSHVAHNYEFIGSLEAFLLDMHEKGWPIRLANLPKPPHFKE
jgi:hypothetical protein